MATHSDTILKLARLEKGTANVNRLIVANLRNYSDLEKVVSDFVSDPSENSAHEIDTMFEKCVQGLETIRNAVSYVAMMAIDDDSEQEEMHLFGVQEEDGVRLN